MGNQWSIINTNSPTLGIFVGILSSLGVATDKSKSLHPLRDKFLEQIDTIPWRGDVEAARLVSDLNLVFDSPSTHGRAVLGRLMSLEVESPVAIEVLMRAQDFLANNEEQLITALQARYKELRGAQAIGQALAVLGVSTVEELAGTEGLRIQLGNISHLIQEKIDGYNKMLSYSVIKDDLTENGELLRQEINTIKTECASDAVLNQDRLATMQNLITEMSNLLKSKGFQIGELDPTPSFDSVTNNLDKLISVEEEARTYYREAFSALDFVKSDVAVIKILTEDPDMEVRVVAANADAASADGYTTTESTPNVSPITVGSEQTDDSQEPSSTDDSDESSLRLG